MFTGGESNQGHSWSEIRRPIHRATPPLCNDLAIKARGIILQVCAVLENSDNSWFCSDLELVRPIYFAENVLLSVRKIAVFVYLSEFNFDRLL